MDAGISQVLKNQLIIMQQNELIAQQNSYIIQRSYRKVSTTIAMDRLLSVVILERGEAHKETYALCDSNNQSC